MAVLLTYHKLVERDAKNIVVYWKGSSIILLVLAIVGSLGISLSLQQLTSAFDDHCVLQAEVAFETDEEKQAYLKPNLSQDKLAEASDFNGTLTSVWKTKSFVALSEVYNASYAAFLTNKPDHEFPTDQVEFLLTHHINDRSTVWSKKDACEFGVYIPICQCCFGIIMATMFVICGRGGKTDAQSFLPQPWRIVSPALVFFLVMTILSVVNLFLIKSGMNTFCGSFEKHLPDIGCDIALNRYMKVSHNTSFKLSPSIFNKILKSFNYTTWALWLASLLVLLARIIFVIDFQLVRVTVKTFEYEEANETSKFHVVDIEENGKDENGELIATTKC